MYNAKLLRLSHNAEGDAIGVLPTLNGINNTTYREKKRFQPPQPTAAADGAPKSTRGAIDDGQPFLVIDHSAEQTIFGFASPASLKLFAQATEIFLDGTSFITPCIFHQLLTVDLSVSCKFMTCAYVLLPGRPTAVYVCTLSLLKAACTSTGNPIPAPTFFTGFEQGLIKALRAVFPGAIHRGRHFHFSQRIQVLRLSLQTTYNQVPSVKLLVQNMVALFSFLS